MDSEKMNGEEKETRARSGGAVVLLVGLFALTLGAVMLLAAQATRSATGPTDANSAVAAVAAAPGEVISLPEQYELPVRWGDLGPQLIAAGAIDAERFVQLYADSGQALSAEQERVLREGSDEPIVINFENARFVLNFFWALGLVNENVLLTEGPMVEHSGGNIGGYASTGGWSLGSRPATALYASQALVALTVEQQARLEDVANNVYRPCCDNHTGFPDCNHGMAMLGILELLASQDASTDEMFAAAKAINGFWFPQQSLHAAAFFKATMNLDYADTDPRMATGPDVFSGSGSQRVHQWLAENDLLPAPEGGSNSCGV